MLRRNINRLPRYRYQSQQLRPVCFAAILLQARDDARGEMHP
jgi:hypothetical protein